MSDESHGDRLHISPDELRKLLGDVSYDETFKNVPGQKVDKKESEKEKKIVDDSSKGISQEEIDALLSGIKDLPKE